MDTYHFKAMNFENMVDYIDTDSNDTLKSIGYNDDILFKLTKEKEILFNKTSSVFTSIAKNQVRENYIKGLVEEFYMQHYSQTDSLSHENGSFLKMLIIIDLKLKLTDQVFVNGSWYLIRDFSKKGNITISTRTNENKNSFINPTEIVKIRNNSDIISDTTRDTSKDILENSTILKMKNYLSENGINSAEELVGIIMTKKYYTGSYISNAEGNKEIRKMCLSVKCDKLELQLNKNSTQAAVISSILEKVYGINMNVFFIEILKKYYHKCSSPEYKNNKIVDTKELNLCYKIICTYSEVDIRDAPRAMNFDKFTTFIKIWKAKIDSN